MSLLPGTRLGSYEIVAAIGAGGMGEVFRARDTKLGREVAIKVLPAAMAQDVVRLARFEREAKLLASLNHSNISQVYGFEHADLLDGTSAHFLAMELVEGEDLAERLRRGAIPVNEAISIARQIAEALEEAHEKGIVHRDLKPGNIRLTPDGVVKVLDFGLAKANVGDPATSGAPDLSRSPTVTGHLTEAGALLGTAAYMSPEQARGKSVDRRADIWAFGAVLLEMLTGERAFGGESVGDVLVAVLSREPNWAALPSSLSKSHRLLLTRCLERDPKKRLRDIGEARLALENNEPAPASDFEAQPAAAGRSPRSRVASVSAGLAALALVTAILLLSRRNPSSVSLDTARFTPFATEGGVQSMPSWSPDGQTLAYSGEVAGYYQIFTRQLGQSTASQLTNFDADCLFPKWDPTGTKVFFQRSPGTEVGEVFVVGAAGGAPERVSESTSAFAVTPAGDAIVYSKAVSASTGQTRELWSHDLKDGADKKLQALSNDWATISGESGGFHFSPDGRHLALLKGTRDDEILLLPTPLKGDQDSRAVPFTSLEGGGVSLSDFSFLPDSRRFVTALRDPRGGDSSLWLGDIGSRTVTRLTTSVQWEYAPAVAPDGSRVAFSSTPLNWDLVEVDLKSGESRPLVASSRYDAWGEWLPDGSGILYSTNRTGRFEIWSESLRDSFTRAIVTPDAFPEGLSLFLVQGAVSPDSRSVAYVRVASNGSRVYVSAVAGSKPVLLTEGAGNGIEGGPVWSPDGRWLLFRGDGNRLLKALARGGTKAMSLAEDAANSESQRAGWLPDGSAVIYQASDGLRLVSADGGPSRLVSSEKPLVWDLGPGGRVLHAILEGERRAVSLATIDLSTGKVTTRKPMGRRPLWPALGYSETLRAMRVSPDGTRLMYAILKPESDIWILEDFTPKSRPWWAFWRG